MKTAQAFLVLLIGTALSIAPLSAQRPGGGGHSGGGHGGGGGRPSSSMGGGSRPSPSTSRPAASSSRPSGSYSSGSRPSSQGSYSGHTPSKSTASYGSRPSSTGANTSSPRPTSHAVTKAGASPHAHYGTTRIGGNTKGGIRPRPNDPKGGRYGNPAPRGSHNGPGPRAVGPAGRPHYATPGHPHAPMPPAMRPMRPAPYFHHPIHGGIIHMHPIFWDPVPCHIHYWPGFWSYCHGYWHDYHVADVVVVREYVRDNYGTDLVTYVMSGDIMYALTRADGETYLQVFDKEDNLLAQQKVNKKYTIMELDKENGGCWIMKKKNKDPLLFLYNDGELLIYEAD